MVKSVVTFVFLFIALCAGNTNASAQPGMEPLRKMYAVMNSIKQLKTFSYHYTVEAKYPDSTSEKMDGYIYSDGPGKTLFAYNDLVLSLSDSLWSYNADHSAKKITIVNMKRRAADKRNVGLQEYQGDMFSMIIDSVIVKYAILKTYRESSDTLYLAVDFPRMSMMPMTRLELQYSLKRQLPYSLQIYYAEDLAADMNGKVKTIYQKYSCYNYSRKLKKYKTDDFFKIRNGKVSLHKYKDYKLNTSL